MPNPGLLRYAACIAVVSRDLNLLTSSLSWAQCNSCLGYKFLRINGVTPRISLTTLLRISGYLPGYLSWLLSRRLQHDSISLFVSLIVELSPLGYHLFYSIEILGVKCLEEQASILNPCLTYDLFTFARSSTKQQVDKWRQISPLRNTYLKRWSSYMIIL